MTPAPRWPPADPLTTNTLTTDGLATDGSDPDERLMVSLSRPERVTGADRTTLAKLLADRYEGGATLTQLAEKIKRSTGLVRKLIDETGVAIRKPGTVHGPGEEESETTEPTEWMGPPEPMARVPPEDLDWSWRDVVVYHAELALELYVQGRSYDEVATVTGYPADDVRALALAAGVARPHRIEELVAAWRYAARAKLRRVCLTNLLHAWVDGIEIEDLAQAHNVPADLLWDVIAGEFARVTQTKTLRDRTLHAKRRPPCAGTCLYGCAQTCAATIPTAPPTDSTRALPGRSWPPRAELNDQFTVNDNGTVTWKWFSNPPSH